MNAVDLTPIINNDTEFEKLANSVSDRYKCEWDDSVHDSFGLYLKQVQDRAQTVRTIRCKAETIVKEVEELKIDDLVTKAEGLCKEADAV